MDEIVRESLFADSSLQTVFMNNGANPRQDRSLSNVDVVANGSRINYSCYPLCPSGLLLPTILVYAINLYIQYQVYHAGRSTCRLVCHDNR
jgi:hypothetical protein